MLGWFKRRREVVDTVPVVVNASIDYNGYNGDVERYVATPDVATNWQEEWLQHIVDTEDYIEQYKRYSNHPSWAELSYHFNYEKRGDYYNARINREHIEALAMNYTYGCDINKTNKCKLQFILERIINKNLKGGDIVVSLINEDDCWKVFVNHEVVNKYVKETTAQKLYEQCQMIVNKLK